jgi:hypothetical protein
MSQYLQRLNIASVEEVGVDTNMPHYTQHVNVVEVVDSDGNPWEPVPGPDPWDELSIADKPLWHEDNIYEEGNTLTATTGTFVGGNPDNTVYRWRFQTRAKPEDSWVNGTWTNYPNDLQQVSYPNVSGGQIRLQVQARDAATDPENVVQVNSFTNTKTVAYTPLSVSTPVASGLPYVGETITCTTPTVTGGDGSYQIDYFWVDETNAMIWEVPYMSQTTVVTSYDVGKLMKCLVTVTSGDGQSTMVASNELGPMEYYTIGTLSVTNTTTNTPLTEAQIEEILKGATANYTATYTGNLPASKALWQWSVRNGACTISGPNNQASATVEVANEFPSASSLSVAIQSSAAEDSTSFSWTISTTE